MTTFKIDITCKMCGSKNIEVDLWMNQGAGLLQLECLDCDNKPRLSLETNDLQNAINKN